MKVIDTIRAPIKDTALTDEGFLFVKAVPIARPGVFPYMTSDGYSQQAKLPDDLFSGATINSANGKPITNDHPSEAVTSENIKQYGVGMTMNDAAIVDNKLAVSMTITDSDTIRDIQNGKRELSIGFATDISPEQGTYNGETYDRVQRDIVINHVAIVDKGRAGSSVALNVDSADTPVSYMLDSFQTKPGKKIGGNSEMKIKVNGQEIDLTNDGAQAEIDTIVAGLKKSSELTNDEALDTITGLNKQIETLTGERDALKAKTEKLVADAADFEATLTEKVKARVELEATAKTILGDKADFAGTDRDIKVQVIKAVNGVDVADSASDDYVEGAYGVAMATKPKKNGNIDIAHAGNVSDNDDLEDNLKKLREARTNLKK
ncbi:DUF2213 domain-containing protein [Weissella sp. MSCH1]|uniref:DUF2213 domain-containing protein n=1 Tax=Weissella sp. MSCH1 TaxID=3383343 RepID=UPI003896C885